MNIIQVVLVALAGCELRWRFTWLRVLLVIVAALELQFATGLGPAYRRAVAPPRRVMMPGPTSQPERLASDYLSGVLVMRQEAKRDLSDINFPLGILVWLVIYPVVLPVLSRGRRRASQNPGTPGARG